LIYRKPGPARFFFLLLFYVRVGSYFSPQLSRFPGGQSFSFFHPALAFSLEGLAFRPLCGPSFGLILLVAVFTSLHDFFFRPKNPPPLGCTSFRYLPLPGRQICKFENKFPSPVESPSSPYWARRLLPNPAYELLSFL